MQPSWWLRSVATGMHIKRGFPVDGQFGMMAGRLHASASAVLACMPLRSPSAATCSCLRNSRSPSSEATRASASARARPCACRSSCCCASRCCRAVTRLMLSSACTCGVDSSDNGSCSTSSYYTMLVDAPSPASLQPLAARRLKCTQIQPATQEACA